MPQTDFTLNDIVKVVRDEIKQAVEESELRITKTVKECFDIYDKKFDDLGNRLERVENRLGKVEFRLDTVEQKLTTAIADHRSTHRLVGQHSKEIMELKAHTA